MLLTCFCREKKNKKKKKCLRLPGGYHKVIRGVPSKKASGRNLHFSVRLLTKPDGTRAFAATWLLKEAM